MAFYTQYSSDWLEDQDSIRIVLIEVSILKWSGTAWVAQSLYFSNGNYITTSGDVSFNSISMSDITLNESLSQDGGVAMAYGDIELANHNGEFDDYLNNALYIWPNGTIKMYYGDPSWICADIATIRTNFLTIFDGVIDDIDSRTTNTINIKLRDKLDRLNFPTTQTKLGVYGTWAGGQLNGDTIVPLIFGEVHNVEPLLIDPARLQYKFNQGTSEKLIEIRDNGVPIYTAETALSAGASVDNTASVFTLSSPLVGTVTISVQGVKNSINLNTGATTDIYNNSIASIIALIVTQYGNSATKFTAADLDLVNLAAFASTNSQAVGVIVSDRENVLNLCKNIASSVGAQLFITRGGKLQLLRYGDTAGYNTGRTITSITEADIIYNSLSISNKLPLQASVKLAYCKNWTVQSNLVTNIKQAYKDNFATEWLTYTRTDSTLTSLYKLDTDPVQKDTLLIIQAEAELEALRLLNYYSTQRTIYKFTGGPRLLALNLGQTVNLIHSRFNLYQSGVGKSGQVVALRPNWTKSSVEVEVII